MSEIVSERVVNPVLVDLQGERPDIELKRTEAKENFRKMMNDLKDDPLFDRLPVPAWYKEEHPEIYGEQGQREQSNFVYAVKSSQIEDPEERAKMLFHRIKNARGEISDENFSPLMINGEDGGNQNSKEVDEQDKQGNQGEQGGEERKQTE